MALRTRRAFLLSGGYDARGRRLSKNIREAVIANAGGCCSLCRKRGTEIDHILGPSDEISNLQLLCWSCHAKKTAGALKAVTPDHPRYEALMRKVQELEERIYSRTPLSDCDDEEQWDNKYKTLLLKRKVAYERWLLGLMLPFVKKNVSARKITMILNDGRIPTFAGKGKWDNKTISKIIRIERNRS